MYKVINNADMYRLWRHLHKVGDGSFYWVHGFRTNKHDRFVTLDDYEGELSLILQNESERWDKPVVEKLTKTVEWNLSVTL